MKYLMILAVLLCGCSRKTPVENIVDNQVGHISDVLDYSYNNFDQTTEIKFLENELESCVVSLESVKQAYYSEIDGCNGKVDYWRMVALFLGLVILGGVFIKIKGVLK